jgi:hypothetical protein
MIIAKKEESKELELEINKTEEYDEQSLYFSQTTRSGNMSSKILGYGEDALTLWALKQHPSKILGKFQDATTLADCLVFYRPSFGRHSKANSSVFGEFDAIIASKENVYLIESKWDNLTEFNDNEFSIRDEQTLRHKVFSWYLVHWNKKYFDKWQSFVSEQKENFPFPNKTIAPNGSLLARNLEFVLDKTHERCRSISEINIKNVLLFFYNAKNKPPTKISRDFTLLPIAYDKEIEGTFVTL